MTVPMKHLMLFLAMSVLAFCAPMLFSQKLDSVTLQLNKQCRTWVSLNRSPHQVSGYLSQISDSSILVVSDLNGLLDLQIKDIETIKARNKYSRINGALIGAAVGGAHRGCMEIFSG
jgi:hypothetical protein